jgi:hypothetical protein
MQMQFMMQEQQQQYVQQEMDANQRKMETMVKASIKELKISKGKGESHVRLS